ncbi:hypothetical protein QFC19_008994 [Naganishia cerealis]|uniref:Uncharacterized protein n=1 Tax=Naganishia cerealis TaxID=610337 RepID=A0ACC2UXB0_9TREE|nr:hypothetical protein QFC19_008994 [Naganishia cerealis]
MKSSSKHSHEAAVPKVVSPRLTMDDPRIDDPSSRLKEMGYDQELRRSLGMVSVLGLSFAIMAVPFGLSTTLNIALTNGGPVTIIWGWIFVSVISILIAASLGEICSVFPTSGGVYYWAAMLSTPKYSAFASYVNGWLGLVGNWTANSVTASITFGGSQLVLAAITLWKEDYVPTAWQTVLTYWAALIISVTIIVVILTMADTRNSAKFAFTHFDNSYAGWPKAWSFFVGVLQSAYTLTGYGMVAALCEEVKNPAREVPRAMGENIPLNFVLPAIEPLLNVASLQPIPLFFKIVTGSPSAAFGLLFLIYGIWLFAFIGSLTAASRATWAFARDGGIPASFLWKKVNTRTQVPINALLLSAVVNALLGLIYLGSYAAFNAFTGVATICLGASYGFPILCSLLRKRALVKNAPFSLGKFGFIINIITIIWITFSIVLFCMPTAIPVTAGSMNYASAVFAGFSAIAVLWYAVNARKHYKGPLISSVREKTDEAPVSESKYHSEPKEVVVQPL